MAKAVLVRHEKRILKNKLIMEVKVWAVDSYPLKIKYSFICIRPHTNELILFDNHLPKRPHYHIDDKEFEYNFDGIDKLIQDFKNAVQNRFGIIL